MQTEITFHTASPPTSEMAPTSLSTTALAQQSIDSEPEVPPAPLLSRLPIETFALIVSTGNCADIELLRALCLVNRRMRNVCEEAPTLWNFIHIDMMLSDVAKRIRLSKAAPLHLCLSLSPNVSQAAGETKLMSFAKLLSTAEFCRLRTYTAITIQPTWTTFALRLLRHYEANLANLRTVDIGLANPYRDAPQAVDMDALPIFGKVLNLSIHRVEFWIPSLPQFPRLLALTVTRCMTSLFEHLLQSLSDMRALQCLTLRDIPDSDLLPMDWDAAELPELTNIELQHVASRKTAALFTAIIPVNLRSLVIRPMERPDDYLFGADLSTVLQLHASRVRELQVVQGTVGSLTTVLSTFTALTHLRTVSCSLCDEDLMTVSCPTLTHIMFDNTLTVSTRAVRSLVESHAAIGSIIQSVILRGWFSSQVSNADVDHIQEIVRNVEVDVVDLRAVLNDVDNSMGNDSSVDESWSADLEADEADWMNRSLLGRWMELRSHLQVPPDPF